MTIYVKYVYNMSKSTFQMTTNDIKSYKTKIWYQWDKIRNQYNSYAALFMLEGSK